MGKKKRKKKQNKILKEVTYMNLATSINTFLTALITLIKSIID